MVSRSAMVRASDLRRELVEEIGVRAGVDLARQELGGGAHRDARHLTPQRLARARGVELDLLLRGRENARALAAGCALGLLHQIVGAMLRLLDDVAGALARSEEHTSELQSQFHLVCRLLLEKKKKKTFTHHNKKKKNKKKN